MKKTNSTELSSLNAISPLDGRYGPLLDQLRPLVSEEGLIHYRMQIEIRWLMKMAQDSAFPEVPTLSTEAQNYLEKLLEEFDSTIAFSVKSIEKTTNHDLKAVEYQLQQSLEKNAELKPLIPFIHFACTSEDINNLSYGLMLKEARTECLLPCMFQLISRLHQMTQDYAEIPMLARTHGQPATPTTLGKELANVVARLQRCYESFKAVPIMGKFNGAVGNFNAHQIAYPEVDWLRVSEDFVSSLGLSWNAYTTQIEPHDELAAYLQHLIRFNSILVDLSRDLWAYISLGYFKQKTVDHEIGSSTMPHKVNPIDFENAEGNLGLANALSEHLASKLPISRWQRDLSDSTVLRNLGSTLGYSLLAYQNIQKGLNKLEADKARIESDLNSHWEVLAEAIQTVMRRYGQENAYEALKELTRGKTITPDILKEFINSLNLPSDVKQHLSQLTPLTYIGYAAKLARSLTIKP